MAINVDGGSKLAQTPSPSPATPAPQPTPSASSVASDSFKGTPAPINIMTFNTAGDGCRGTPQDQLPLSAPFQKVIQGAPDASIIGMQEMTRPLTTKLTQLAKNGNFQFISKGPTWVPSFIRLLSFMPDNAVMVPKRYQVENVHWINFSGRGGLFFQALKNFLFHGKSAGAMINAIFTGGCCELQLKDKITGKSFTVFANHICGADPVRRVQEAQLIPLIKAAQAKGPVAVLGDFNTASEATNFKHDPNITNFWNELKPLNLTDNGSTDKTSGGQEIDHVLTSGFTTVGDTVYDGNKLTLPGRPNAAQVSDHYAHGVSLEFAPPS